MFEAYTFNLAIDLVIGEAECSGRKVAVSFSI